MARACRTSSRETTLIGVVDAATGAITIDPETVMSMSVEDLQIASLRASIRAAPALTVIS